MTLQIKWLSSGEDVASLRPEDDEDADNADSSPLLVRTVKQRLVKYVDQPRFRQKLLNCSGILEDDAEVTPPDTLYLVLLSFSPSSQEQQTEWFEAAARADIPKMEKYLLAPHDPNVAAERGETAVHVAATLGNLQLCSLLIEARASVNQLSLPTFDGGSVTPLHMASVRGHVAVVELLLDAKSDANKTTRDGDHSFAFCSF